MMRFSKSNSFDIATVQEKIMGPNPLKLCEELLKDTELAEGSIVMDLGSGNGITSVMLAREYGLTAYAVDLWSNPEDNQQFFQEMGLSEEQLTPVKADVTQGLPFEQEFFDAVVSVDSYHYYGRDSRFLGEKLLPYLKQGGMLYLAMPGMVEDRHSNLPSCLLASWTPEELDYMHDISWWREMIQQTEGVEIVNTRQMKCTEEAWADWLACDNEYAKNDREAIKAGALEYLNVIALVLRKK